MSCVMYHGSAASFCVILCRLGQSVGFCASHVVHLKERSTYANFSFYACSLEHMMIDLDAGMFKMRCSYDKMCKQTSFLVQCFRYKINFGVGIHSIWIIYNVWMISLSKCYNPNNNYWCLFEDQRVYSHTALDPKCAILEYHIPVRFVTASSVNFIPLI